MTLAGAIESPRAASHWIPRWMKLLTLWRSADRCVKQDMTGRYSRSSYISPLLSSTSSPSLIRPSPLALHLTTISAPPFSLCHQHSLTGPAGPGLSSLRLHPAKIPYQKRKKKKPQHLWPEMIFVFGRTTSPKYRDWNKINQNYFLHKILRFSQDVNWLLCVFNVDALLMNDNFQWFTKTVQVSLPANTHICTLQAADCEAARGPGLGFN